jgi:hypothetical protein
VHGALFGAPPLLDGEDAAAYDGLVERVAGAVVPADVLEEMWVRDVVDLAWEALRWRRLKASLLAAAAHEGVLTVLTPLIGYADAHALAGQWARGARRARQRVRTLLAGAGLTMEAARAQTLANRIGEIERIDHMAMQAEARRAAALREIEHHRAALAQALSDALAAEADEDVDDAYQDDAYQDGAYRNGADAECGGDHDDADAAFAARTDRPHRRRPRRDQ